MTLSRLALVIAALATIGLIGVLLWITTTYINGIPILYLLLEMTVVLKALMFFGVLSGLAGVLIGLASRPSPSTDGGRAGSAEILLWLTAAGSFAFGFLGWAYGELNTQSVIAAIGPVSFAVAAPSRAEGLLCLITGLIGAMPSLGFIQALEARRRKAARAPAA